MRDLFFTIFSMLPICLFSQTFDSLVLAHSMTIYYPTGKYNIEQEYMPIANSIVDSLTNDLSLLVKLEGHTDDVGTLASNDVLSQNRASTLVKFLKEHGISEERIFSSHYGELKPATVNIDEQTRKNNRRLEIMLYKVKKMRSIKGKLVDETSLFGVQGKIEVNATNFSDSISTNPSGHFYISVPDNGYLDIHASSNGYFDAKKTIKVSEALQNREVEIILSKIEIGKKVDIENMFFYPDLPKPLPASIKVMDQLYNNLTSNLYCFEIRGHVNGPNLGRIEKTHPYYALSKARAKTVYDYLVEHGIDPNRMVYNGYGNWEMIYPNATTNEEMEKNRRVEIKAIPCEKVKQEKK